MTLRVVERRVARAVSMKVEKTEDEAEEGSRSLLLATQRRGTL